MAAIIFYDPADPVVANRVTKFSKKKHTPDFVGVANTLIVVNNPSDPSWSEISNLCTVSIQAVEAIPAKYRKKSSNKVIEMTTAQKAAIDQAEADALAQQQANARDFTKALSKLDKSILLVLLDYINGIIDGSITAPISVSEAKTDVENKYDTL